MRCTGLSLCLIFLLCACSGDDELKKDTVGTLDGSTPDVHNPKPDQFKVTDTSPTLWKLYAHDQKKLFVIDPTTLKAGKPKLSVVGSFAFDASIPTNERSVNDIAVTPDGKLYAVSKTTLYRVDPFTAKLTKVTVVKDKDDKSPPPNVSLTFEKSGMLLASDMDGALRRIHYQGSKMGKVEDIGDYGNGQGSSGDLVAIKDGTLFGVSHKGMGASSSNNKLLKIDPNTGKATPIGSIGHGYVWGLAYWAGVVYGFTSEKNPDGGKLLKIDPKTGKGTLMNEYPYFSHQFWGAAVTPMAPIK